MLNLLPSNKVTHTHTNSEYSSDIEDELEGWRQAKRGGDGFQEWYFNFESRPLARTRGCILSTAILHRQRR